MPFVREGVKWVYCYDNPFYVDDMPEGLHYLAFEMNFFHNRLSLRLKKGLIRHFLLIIRCKNTKKVVHAIFFEYELRIIRTHWMRMPN